MATTILRATGAPVTASGTPTVVGTAPLGDLDDATYVQMTMTVGGTTASRTDGARVPIEQLTIDPANVVSIGWGFRASGVSSLSGSPYPRLGFTLQDRTTFSSTMQSVDVQTDIPLGGWWINPALGIAEWSGTYTEYDYSSASYPSTSLLGVATMLTGATNAVWVRPLNNRVTETQTIKVYEAWITVTDNTPAPTTGGRPRRGPRVYPLKSQQWTARRGPGSFY